VTATSKTARPQKSEPRIKEAPKPAAAKSKKKATGIVKTAAAKHTTPELVVPNQKLTTSLEEITDFLDLIPIPACVLLTRRFVTYFSFLPAVVSRPRADLKTDILFVAEYDSTPRRTERALPLRLARWNADGVRGRKLELEHFLSQHSVDISLK
jgi:hypothetical protein